jgi:hypothetical protein
MFGLLEIAENARARYKSDTSLSRGVVSSHLCGAVLVLKRFCVINKKRPFVFRYPDSLMILHLLILGMSQGGQAMSKP